MKFAKRVLSLILGKTYLQPLFEKLLLFSLAGMNIGLGGDIKNSGEVKLLTILSNRFKKDQKEEKIIFDVGANVGEWIKVMVRAFKGINFKVYAFEPLPEAFKQLNKIVDDLSTYLPGSCGQIKTYNFGFSDKCTRALIHYDSEKSGLSSLYERRLEHFGIELTNRVEIELQTIDDFCYANKIEHIDFLKLDVEGHELNILKGAQRMLQQGKISHIQFEFGGCNIDSRTYFQDFYYFLKDKYKLYRICKDGVYPIKYYKETYEIFITTNYFAEIIK